MSNRMIGVDVGGTFTDIFVLDEVSGLAEVAKVPTTRPDQSGGFLSGIESRVDDLSTVSVVVATVQLLELTHCLSAKVQRLV